jgi:predicted nucleic acid-binding protein
MSACELYVVAARSHRPGPNRRAVGEFLRALPVPGLDAASAERFGTSKASLGSTGRRLTDADLPIASIALAAGALPDTGNARHHARMPELQTQGWIPREPA